MRLLAPDGLTSVATRWGQFKADPLGRMEVSEPEAVEYLTTHYGFIPAPPREPAVEESEAPKVGRPRGRPDGTIKSP